MRIFIKVIFIILIFFIGTIIMGVMKEVGIQGAIPMIALFSGMLAAMRAIWRYNPKKNTEIANGIKLDKER